MDNSGDHFDDGDTYPEILEPIAYENTQLSDFEDDLNTSNVLNFLFEISPNENSFEIINNTKIQSTLTVNVVERKRFENVKMDQNEKENMEYKLELLPKLKLKLFQEEQKIRLEKIDDEEEKQKAYLRQIAKKELDDWYKTYNEQIAMKKKAALKKQFIAESDKIEPGTEWARISNYCDFNKRNCTFKDKTCMKQIILKLQQLQLKKPIN